MEVTRLELVTTECKSGVLPVELHPPQREPFTHGKPPGSSPAVRSQVEGLKNRRNRTRPLERRRPQTRAKPAARRAIPNRLTPQRTTKRVASTMSGVEAVRNMDDKSW